MVVFVFGSIEYVVSHADRNAKNGDGSPAASTRNDRLTQFLVSQALREKYPPSEQQQARGVVLGAIKDKDAKKMAGKIQNALQRAVNDESASITFDQTQAEWVRDVISDWNPPQEWAGWRLTLFDYADEAIRAGVESESRKKNGAGERDATRDVVRDASK